MKVRNAGTEQDLGIQYKALKPEVDKLNIMAAKRQQVKLGRVDSKCLLHFIIYALKRARGHLCC